MMPPASPPSMPSTDRAELVGLARAARLATGDTRWRVIVGALLADRWDVAARVAAALLQRDRATTGERELADERWRDRAHALAWINAAVAVCAVAEQHGVPGAARLHTGEADNGIPRRVYAPAALAAALHHARVAWGHTEADPARWHPSGCGCPDCNAAWRGWQTARGAAAALAPRPDGI